MDLNPFLAAFKVDFYGQSLHTPLILANWGPQSQLFPFHTWLIPHLLIHDYPILINPNLHWQTLLTSYSVLEQIGEQLKLAKLNWVFVGQIKHVVLLTILLLIKLHLTLEIHVDWH